METFKTQLKGGPLTTQSFTEFRRQLYAETDSDEQARMRKELLELVHEIPGRLTEEGYVQVIYELEYFPKMKEKMIQTGLTVCDSTGRPTPLRLVELEIRVLKLDRWISERGD
jgi:hypothetical protein